MTYDLFIFIRSFTQSVRRNMLRINSRETLIFKASYENSVPFTLMRYLLSLKESLIQSLSVQLIPKRLCRIHSRNFIMGLIKYRNLLLRYEILLKYDWLNMNNLHQKFFSLATEYGNNLTNLFD